MTRYWRVYRTFLISAFARELEFRANFFAKVIQNLLWIFFFVAILYVIYANTNQIAGWNREEAMVLAATVFLMNALSGALFFSLSEIPQQVRMGTLDFVVTKPIDSQFWVSTRRFNFDQIGTLIAGILMIGYGVSVGQFHPTPLQWIAYLLLVAASLTIFYAFNLALMTTGIWLVRVDNLWVLSESVVQVARYPLDIYNGGIQRFLTFAVPVGFLATVPARQLVHEFDAGMLALGLGWAAASLVLCRIFWKFALRYYGSASS